MGDNAEQTQAKLQKWRAILAMQQQKTLAVLLFPQFELLGVFGPLDTSEESLYPI